MHPIARIRLEIFKVTQAEFAALAGVAQGTVSRWEAGEFEPTRDQLLRIRNAASARKILWNDAWFFSAPVPSEAAA